MFSCVAVFANILKQYDGDVLIADFLIFNELNNIVKERAKNQPFRL